MLAGKPILKPGIPVTIGGDVYTAAPLSLGGIKALQAKLETGGVGIAETVSTAFTLSLRRNYPELTQIWLDDNMDGAEYVEAAAKLTELMRISGLKPAEEPNPGEAPAAGSDTSTAP